MKTSFLRPHTEAHSVNPESALGCCHWSLRIQPDTMASTKKHLFKRQKQKVTYVLGLGQRPVRNDPSPARTLDN